MENIINDRFSPYSFTGKAISKENVVQLFNAARQAASSYNEQPWRFVYAQKSNKKDFEKILSCLVEGNRDWAKTADLLILSFTKKTFSQNGKENSKAQHDLGLAAGNLTTQASLLDIYVHNMGGILTDKIRKDFNVPDDYEVMTAIAAGYTDEKNPQKEKKTLEEIAGEGSFDFI